MENGKVYRLVLVLLLFVSVLLQLFGNIIIRRHCILLFPYTLFSWYIGGLLGLIYASFHFQTIDTFWFVSLKCFTLCVSVWHTIVALIIPHSIFIIRKISFQALQRESYSINVISHHFMPKYFVASSKQMSTKHEIDGDGSFNNQCFVTGKMKCANFFRKKKNPIKDDLHLILLWLWGFFQCAQKKMSGWAWQSNQL